MMTGTEQKTNPYLLALTAWILPGGGYLMLRKYFRAALFFVAVTTLFWLSIYLKAHFVFPSDEGESFALFKFLGEFGNGMHFLIALLGGINMSEPLVLKATLTNEFATTCLYTAGIINVLGIVDAVDILKGRKS